MTAKDVTELALCEVRGCGNYVLPRVRMCQTCFGRLSHRTLCAMRTAWRSRNADAIRKAITYALREAEAQRELHATDT